MLLLKKCSGLLLGADAMRVRSLRNGCDVARLRLLVVATDDLLGRYALDNFDHRVRSHLLPMLELDSARV